MKNSSTPTACLPAGTRIGTWSGRNSYWDLDTRGARSGRVSGLTAPLDHAGTRTGIKRDLLQNSYRDALRDSHRRSYRNTQPRRDTEELVAGQSGTSCGARAGTRYETPAETRSGTSCRARTRTRLVVARLEAVSKGNSRVKIEQRRRVQHLEKFRIFRVPVRPKRRDFRLIYFLYFFLFFLCTLPKPSRNRGGKKFKLKKKIKKKIKKHSPAAT